MRMYAVLSAYWSRDECCQPALHTLLGYCLWLAAAWHSNSRLHVTFSD